LRQFIQLELSILAQVGRGEQRVQNNSTVSRLAHNSNLPERVIDQFWNEARQKGAVDFETWVGIHFNQIGSEVFIDHEIVSKELNYQVKALAFLTYLKRVLKSVGVYFADS
jgi:hypothetical protein